MANLRASLVKLTRTAEGWQRYPVIYGRNGRIKPGAVRVNGTEVASPEGDYYLRYYEGRKLKYRRIGPHAGSAHEELVKQMALLEAKRKAEEAGAVITVVEESGRKTLRRAAQNYIRFTENKGATEAAEQARNVTDEFIQVARKSYVDELNQEDIFRYHRVLRERGCSPRTVANKHARLKSFLLHAGVQNSIFPPKPKYEQALPTIYAQDELKAILRAADGSIGIAIEMALKLGLREQELVYAEWMDLDVEDAVFRVQGKAHWNFKVKDSEQRDVPVPAALLKTLKAWRKLRPKSRLILGTGTDQPNNKLLRTLKRLAKKAGLNCGQCAGCKANHNECQRWTLHKFRRTYLTTLLRNGIDLRTVQSYAGHADLDSTLRYLKPAAAKETQARISAIRFS